jgi:hypothetical protein
MRSVSSSGDLPGWVVFTPQIPVGASGPGLSMKSTCPESGDQKGWVQQPPLVSRRRAGVGVGVGEAVALAVGDGVAEGVGDGVSVGVALALGRATVAVGVDEVA